MDIICEVISIEFIVEENLLREKVWFPFIGDLITIQRSTFEKDKIETQEHCSSGSFPNIETTAITTVRQIRIDNRNVRHEKADKIYDRWRNHPDQPEIILDLFKNDRYYIDFYKDMMPVDTPIKREYATNLLRQILEFSSKQLSFVEAITEAYCSMTFKPQDSTPL